MQKELKDRLRSPLMAYYKAVYADSVMWTGQPLEGKTLIVYCEQGLGDVIQFSRYFKFLREKGCRLLAHCQKSLHRLLAGMADGFIDKDVVTPLPPHDYHVLSLEVPVMLGVPAGPEGRYIFVEGKEPLPEGFKIGVAWEGGVNHSNNAERCCPLEYFKQLSEHAKVYMLQDTIHNKCLIRNCEDMELYGADLGDFLDTAGLVNAVDVVVTVDTSVMHLAAAMGKRTIGLLSHRHDPRWDLCTWYDSLTLVAQKRPGDWDSVFETVFSLLGIDGRRPVGVQPEEGIVLVTGGIGDVFAVESFLTDEQRKAVKKVYYATRAAGSLIGVWPPGAEHVVLYDDFDDLLFAFHSKAEVAFHLDSPPEDWPRTTDWSIIGAFDRLQHSPCNGSGFLRDDRDLSAFDLPERYVVVFPHSDNDPKMTDRNFTKEDWDETAAFLNDKGLRGVVLGTSGRPAPTCWTFIDLIGKTTLAESLTILKGAAGYVGIDSCLSVLAAKLFGEMICVKSRSEHVHRWKHVYYAPHTEFDFVCGSVREWRLTSS